MSGRIRSIKPELIEDAVTASLTDTAFRVFVGMIVLADDYGNLRAEPGWLRAQTHWAATPLTDFEAALELLGQTPPGKSQPLVRYYLVGGQRYAHLTGWGKHQRIHRAGKPRVPRYSEHTQDNVTTLAEQCPAIPTPDHGPGPDPDLGSVLGSESQTRARDDGAFGMAADAYREGVQAGSGKPAPALDWRARAELTRLLVTYGAGREGQALLDWLRDDVAAYVRATRTEARFQRGFHPAKWGEWHTAGCPVGPPSRIRAVTVQQAPEVASWRQRGPTIRAGMTEAEVDAALADAEARR